MSRSPGALLDEVRSLMGGGEYLMAFEKVLNKFSRKLLKPHFYYNRVYVLSYSCARYKPRRTLKTITARTAGREDLPLLKTFSKNKDEYEQRFNRGDACIVAESQGKLIGMKWLEFGQSHHEEADEYLINLPPHSAWSYDAYVLPEYRRKGVLVSLTETQLAHAIDRSVRTIYTMIRSINKLALNSSLRFGWHVSKEVVFLRFLGLRLYVIKNVHFMGVGQEGVWRLHVQPPRFCPAGHRPAFPD